MTSSDPVGGAYDRGHDAGVVAGRIEERLDRAEQHLNKINGSMADVAAAINGLRLDVQSLRDENRSTGLAAVAAAAALERTVDTTARALKEASEARRETSEVKWTPWQRALAFLGGIAAITLVVSAIATWL